jgi:site-specific recombinase
MKYLKYLRFVLVAKQIKLCNVQDLQVVRITLINLIYSYAIMLSIAIWSNNLRIDRTIRHLYNAYIYKSSN